MTGDSILLPADGLAAIVSEIAGFGARDLETGGFLLGRRGEPDVREVAFAGTVGIVRRWNLFQISAKSLDRLFTYADDSDLWIPVQFHSHRSVAVMSASDKRHGIGAEGFISTIVPAFAAPPSDPSAWGWWTFSSGDWVPCAAASSEVGTITKVVEFDEDGVRAR